jgi:hypothetical protein
MELHQWLDAAPGRAAWLAQHLGRSKAAVSLWRDAGVPMDLMQQIADLSDGVVTIDAMLRHAWSQRTQANQTAATGQQQDPTPDDLPQFSINSAPAVPVATSNAGEEVRDAA